MLEEIISKEKKAIMKNLSVSLREYELAKEFVFHMVAALKETVPVDRVENDSNDSPKFDSDSFVFRLITITNIDDLDELKNEWYTYFPKVSNQNFYYSIHAINLTYFKLSRNIHTILKIYSSAENYIYWVEKWVFQIFYYFHQTILYK